MSITGVLTIYLYRACHVIYEFVCACRYVPVDSFPHCVDCYYIVTKAPSSAKELKSFEPVEESEDNDPPLYELASPRSHIEVSFGVLRCNGVFRCNGVL